MMMLKLLLASLLLVGAFAAAATPAAPLKPNTKPLPAGRIPTAIIAIDAGHGGKDTGAVGAHGTQEKTVALAIARKLAAFLRAEPGFRPLLVRKNDRYIGLRQRAAIARQGDADLLLSVHADAAANPKASGSSVYTLKRPSGTAAAASQRAAHQILGELRKRQPVHYPQVESARFAVLKSPDLPSVLIETGYLSNPSEELKLASPAHQEKVARAIFNGVKAYFYAVKPVRGLGVGKGKVILAAGS